MNENYADMTGYTQKEMETCLKPHIARFAQKQNIADSEITERLKLRYNGYRFSEKNIKVYNPFSVLKALGERAFGNYWFETGAPTFLVNILKERNYQIAKIENLRVDEQIFSGYDIENLKPEALLFSADLRRKN